MAAGKMLTPEDILVTWPYTLTSFSFQHWPTPPLDIVRRGLREEPSKLLHRKMSLIRLSASWKGIQEIPFNTQDETV
jgi:hypothetical protein